MNLIHEDAQCVRVAGECVVDAQILRIETANPMTRVCVRALASATSPAAAAT